MVRRCPCLFTFSIANNFMPKYEYFRKETKGDTTDLREFPQYFVFSLEKAEIGRPSLMQPDKGKVSIHVDCSPTATPVFEGRGGEELSSELSLALQRCLLGGKWSRCWWREKCAGIFTLTVLSLVRTEIYLMLLVRQSRLLSNTAIPRVQVAADAASEEQPEVDISDEEILQFDISGVPVIVTLTELGRHYIAPPEEESQMSSAVSVSVNQKSLICSLTKRGSVGLDTRR